VLSATGHNIGDEIRWVVPNSPVRIARPYYRYRQKQRERERRFTNDSRFPRIQSVLVPSSVSNRRRFSDYSLAAVRDDVVHRLCVAKIAGVFTIYIFFPLASRPREYASCVTIYAVVYPPSLTLPGRLYADFPFFWRTIGPTDRTTPFFTLEFDRLLR